jgi:hypothetical protein
MNDESCSPCPPADAPRGVEHAGVIDALTHDARADEVVMVMAEARPWDGSEERLFQLQEKLNAYLSFALDGEMAQTFPHLVEKPLRLRIEAQFMPDERTLGFMQVVHDQVALQGIRFEVRVKDGGCGAGCECAAQG